MAFDEKTRAFVRRFYVFERMSLEQAAEEAGVSFNTARRWKKQSFERGDDWDRVREAHVMAGSDVAEVSKGLLTGFILEYRQSMEALRQSEEVSPVDKAQALSKMADSFAKVVAASKRIMPEVSELATAMRAIEMLGDYLQTNKPELMGGFIEVLADFGDVLTAEFGQK